MQTLVLFIFMPFITTAIKDKNDPGYAILKFMQQYEANLKEPINISDELVCNCSYSGCGEEIGHFFGNVYPFTCRSTSGICYKRLLPDRSVVLSCLSKDASPDLHCRTKQPMNDGSVMQCCQNYSFCNGALDLSSLIDYSSVTYKDNSIPLIHLLIIFFIGFGILAFSIFFTFAWIKKPLKRWIFYWTHHGSGEERSEVTGEEKLLMNSADALGHLSDLLYNLDDSATTGSGSGFPLLAQRTIARQIELQKEIGQGRFGEVWLGYWKGDEVAVKIFSSRDERSWNREVEIFQTNLLRHPNLLRFIASDNKDTGTSTQLWLITEYHEHGSLYDYLSANIVSEPVMLQMIRSIAVGLSFLHNEIPGPRGKPAIAHRDLKSKNILVKSDLTCVIADLGLAVRYMNGEINVPDNSKCGTVRYLAPEILEDCFPTNHFEAYKTADMYAMGLIIWEIMWRCGNQEKSRPFELPYFDCVGRDPTTEEMKLCVCVEKRRPFIQDEWINDKVMGGVLQMMQECWTGSPLCRLTAMNVRKAIDRHAASLGWKLRS